MKMQNGKLFSTGNHPIEALVPMLHLKNAGFDPEYIMLANADTLELMHEFAWQKHMVVLLAAKIEGVRLIDNLRIN